MLMFLFYAWFKKVSVREVSGPRNAMHRDP
jgi:hypothetical protein